MPSFADIEVRAPADVDAAREWLESEIERRDIPVAVIVLGNDTTPPETIGLIVDQYFLWDNEPTGEEFEDFWTQLEEVRQSYYRVFS